MQGCTVVWKVFFNPALSMKERRRNAIPMSSHLLPVLLSLGCPPLFHNLTVVFPQSISSIEALETNNSFLSLNTVETMGDDTEEEEESISEPVDTRSQEELINRLMTDGMSFSEVLHTHYLSHSVLCYFKIFVSFSL